METMTRIFADTGSLLSEGTGMTAGGWPAAGSVACGRARGEYALTLGLTSTDKQQSIRPTTVHVPTGTPPSARWRRP